MKKNLKSLHLHTIAWLMLTSPFLQGMEEEYSPKEKATRKIGPGGGVTDNMLVREDFFKDIVGMDEETFRTTYGWKDGKLQKMLERGFDLDGWFKDSNYPRRRAISQGTFSFYTIEDLDKAIGSKLVKLTSKPSFQILIHDQKNPQATDIRALQADPNNKGAAFQIASTFFGPLEGGMYPWSSYITNMLKGAVQGEEASISAAGATIWRKYFLPTFYAPSPTQLPGYYYLLEKTNIPLFKSPSRISLDNRAIKKYKYDPEHIKKVGVGLHNDVYVTSGYGETIIGRSREDRRPGAKDRQPKIPLSQEQKIAQIFTSAYNLSNVRAEKKDTFQDADPEAQFAQMLLEASYEGVLKAAYVARKPKVFLTLMGAGAFRNDITWIGNALNKSKIIAFIKNTGLQVTIIYRPDPLKQPIRNAEKDIAFLEKMQTIANAINGTRYQISDTTRLSIRQAYGTTTPTTPAPATALQFEEYMKLKNEEKIGWLSKNGKTVLINLGKNENPTIDAHGNANFKYINPDVPSAALPRGLYFWKDQNDRPVIGDHRKKTPVRNQPRTRDFKYNVPMKGYMFNNRTEWDERRISNPHPF